MSEQYTPAVPEGAFALQMVEKYRQLLLDCAGLQQIMIDGQLVNYLDLEKQYEHWMNKLARINGVRPVVSSINLENAR
jgi:hypothetical protein